SIFRSKLLETLHMIALQAAKLLAPPVIRKLRSRRSCEPPRQPIFLATAEHRPDAASRRSLRAYASSGAFQRPLQRLNSLLQGGPLFRGQARRSDGGGRGSVVSRSSLFQDQLLERQVRNRLAEPIVLFLKLLETLHLIARQAASLLSPSATLFRSHADRANRLANRFSLR